jgi:hypothetical protein
MGRRLQSQGHFLGLCCSCGTIADRFDENRQLIVLCGINGVDESNKSVKFASL